MSNSKAVLNLKFRIENSRLRDTLYKSLKPELEIKLRGIQASIEVCGQELLITIKAPDYSALRAASNSILRLMSMILNTLGEVSKE